MRNNTNNPSIRDGKHTEATPALPSTYALRGLGHASLTGEKAGQFADWGKVTRSVRFPDHIGARSASPYRRGIPKTAVPKNEGVTKARLFG